MHQRVRSDVLHTEFGLVIPRRSGVVDDVSRSLVRGYAYTFHITPVEAMLFLQMQDAVERREIMAAAAVVFERHLCNVIMGTEAVQRFRPVRVHAHSRTEAYRPLDDIERAGNPLRRSHCRQRAGLGCMAAVHRLAHCRRTECLLKTGSKSTRSGERMRELFTIAAE